MEEGRWEEGFVDVRHSKILKIADLASSKHGLEPRCSSDVLKDEVYLVLDRYTYTLSRLVHILIR